MALTILFKFCVIIVGLHSKRNKYDTIGFSRKNAWNWKNSFFIFPASPKIKGSSHEKKIKNFYFLKNVYSNFGLILWVYSTFEAQQYDTIGFSRKNPWNWKNIFLIFSVS